MQKFKLTDNIDDLVDEIKEKKGSQKSGITMLVFDDQDNITKAFYKEDNILPSVRDALYEVASYFHGIHIMTRVTLCGGM